MTFCNFDNKFFQVSSVFDPLHSSFKCDSMSVLSQNVLSCRVTLDILKLPKEKEKNN